MILHRKYLTKLGNKQTISFVRANSALEGHRLTITDIKNSIRVVTGKATADDVIEQIILRKGLRKRASSV